MVRYLEPTTPGEDQVAPGSVLAGKYLAKRVIGAGAMGVVVEVTHVDHADQRYALKFLRPSVASDPSAAERFRREAKAAGRIENRHVVRIFEIGELDTKTPYLVMEYLEGSSLESEFQRGTRFELERAADLAQQVAEGLSAAHGMGVIHRDIKPANLFLKDQPDGQAWLKIVDFGISKICDPSFQQKHLTQTQTSIGSPLYMSPEQMRSARTADYRTDQWALGVVLYRMATGRLPFEAPSLPVLCAMVLEGDYPPVSSLRSELPPAFVAAVDRCLRHSPAERFPTIADLALALAPFAGREGTERALRCQRAIDAGRDRASLFPPARTESVHPSAIAATPPPVEPGTILSPAMAATAQEPSAAEPSTVPQPAAVATANETPPPTVRASQAIPSVRRPSIQGTIQPSTPKLSDRQFFAVVLLVGLSIGLSLALFAH